MRWRRLLSVIPFHIVLLPLLLSGAATRHLITIRSQNLYWGRFDWDATAQHFVVGSPRYASLHSVSDAGVIEPLIPSPIELRNVTVHGVTVDTPRRRLLVVVHANTSFLPFNGLAAYDLHSLRRIFLAELPSDSSEAAIADDVAVDPSGNAFVTNSAQNIIWKIDPDGTPLILSRSRVFSNYGIREELAPLSGLSGIVYARNGYFLVIQSNTGKVFKVDSDDGTARLVLLSKNLVGANGITVRRDGAVVVVSRHTAWLLKSDDGWSEAVVFDEIALGENEFAMAVAVREDKVYALCGHMVDDGLGTIDPEEFSIEELQWGREQEDDGLWLFILVGLGLIYFCYWRLQMGQLIRNMKTKKT